MDIERLKVLAGVNIQKEQRQGGFAKNLRTTLLYIMIFNINDYFIEVEHKHEH